MGSLKARLRFCVPCVHWSVRAPTLPVGGYLRWRGASPEQRSGDVTALREFIDHSSRFADLDMRTSSKESDTFG